MPRYKYRHKYQQPLRDHFYDVYRAPAVFSENSRIGRALRRLTYQRCEPLETNMIEELTTFEKTDLETEHPRDKLIALFSQSRNPT